MPISEELTDIGEWSVSLKPDTPKQVLDAIDVRTYAFASIVITPQWFPSGTLSDANLLSKARYTGVYLAQTDGRLNLEGAGLAWWLGDEDDGGDLYTGNSGTSAANDLEAQLDDRIFTSFANGLTKGTVDTLATTRTIKIETGVTRRQFLDTICAIYPSGPYEWRVNPNGSVDVNQAADLWPTVTTPTVVLTQEGGREGAVTGIRAELAINAIDVSEYKTDIVVNWDDTAADHGTATNTPPSTWVDFAGAAPDLTGYLTWKPKQQFRENRRWSLRRNAQAFATWVVNSAVQASQVATARANQVNTYDIELDAEIDEYDPWRFDCSPGNNVYVYDQSLGLTNTAGDEVYYRGEAIHPTELRVWSWTTPIQEGYGVYLRRWTGAAFDYYDLTPYVEFEEDTTTLELGKRNRRLHRKNARPRRINVRAMRARARLHYRWARYFNQPL